MFPGAGAGSPGPSPSSPEFRVASRGNTASGCRRRARPGPVGRSNIGWGKQEEQNANRQLLAPRDRLGGGSADGTAGGGGRRPDDRPRRLSHRQGGASRPPQ